MAWGKKDKKQKKVKNPSIPYQTCGKVIKTVAGPNGKMNIQTICQLNKNVPHGH